MLLLNASFADIDQLSATVESWDAEIVPLGRKPPGSSAGLIIQAGDFDCQYMYAEFGVGYTMRGDPPKGLITFNLQEPTKRHYWWRGHDLDSNTAWVFPVGGELRSISAPGFRVHTLSVPEERVAVVAARFGVELPAASNRPETFRVADNVMHEVRARFNALRDTSVQFRYDYAGDILRLLVSQWLLPDTRTATSRPSIRARDRAIRKGLEIIDGYDMQDLTTEVLLDKCHVSERTLQYAFRERFAATPAAFIKALRLARARSELRRADPDEQTVGDIAAALGIWHLGQFASDYRKRFGERPSETLARAPNR